MKAHTTVAALVLALVASCGLLIYLMTGDIFSGEATSRVNTTPASTVPASTIPASTAPAGGQTSENAGLDTTLASQTEQATDADPNLDATDATAGSRANVDAATDDPATDDPATDDPATDDDEGEEPTPQPTAEPGTEPTDPPTPQPTGEPTPAPTAEPTPTPAPTAEPTPTVQPTPTPSDPGPICPFTHFVNDDGECQLIEFETPVPIAPCPAGEIRIGAICIELDLQLNDALDPVIPIVTPSVLLPGVPFTPNQVLPLFP